MAICIGSNIALGGYNKIGYRINDELVSLYEPAYQDKDIAIFFEGKILNGEKDFSSGQSIATLYRKLGKNFLNYLDGYYGIIIIDHINNSIFMCHDADGVEQIFYVITSQGERQFIISNDVREIVKFQKPKVNEDMLSQYFLHGHIESSDTLFKGIKKLLLLETLENVGGRWLFERYQYDNLLKTDIANGITVERSKSTLYTIMRDQTKSLLRNSINAGCLLSGGVDSSFVQCLLLENGFRNSYSGGYKPVGRENKYALQVAKILDTNHSCWDISADELLNAMRDGVQSCGMPFVYLGEAMQTYIFQKISSKKDGDRVIFGGEMGDSVMGLNLGIDSFFPRVCSQYTPKYIKNFITKYFMGKTNWNELQILNDEQIEVILNKKTHIEQLCRVLKCFQERGLVSEQLYIANFGENVTMEEKITRFRALCGEGMLRIVGTQYQIAKDNNLFFAQPFCNHKLVEFLFSVPNEIRAKHCISKYLTKSLLSDHLPEKLVFRNKICNTVPFSNYFENSENFNNIISEIKESKYSTYFVNLEKFVDDLIRESKSANVINGDLIHLISFHMWYKQFIAN